jgi:hypothetical protein
VALARAGRPARIDARGGEVAQDRVDHPRLGDERDDANFRTAPWTDEWVDLADAADELWPKAGQLGVVRPAPLAAPGRAITRGEG